MEKINSQSKSFQKRNPHLYPSECSERSENPDGAESVKVDDSPCKDERELHDGLERWLRVHDKGPIPYVHSRTDRKSTVRVGFPDFGIFWKGQCAFAEFKMPGEKPTAEQLDCIAELHDSGCPVRVCHSVVDAIEFVREKLGL